jgi:hypothetical protein
LLNSFEIVINNNNNNNNENTAECAVNAMASGLIDDTSGEDLIIVLTRLNGIVAQFFFDFVLFV